MTEENISSASQIVFPGRREAASPESRNMDQRWRGSAAGCVRGTDRVHGFRAPSLRSGPGMTPLSVERKLLLPPRGNAMRLVNGL